MSYKVFDVETTYGTDFGRVSNPFLEKNELVVCATKSKSSDVTLSRYKFPVNIFEHKYLIGHNIKFDLLWLMKYKPDELVIWINNGGKVWDTMLVDYMLHGHLKIGYSLDMVAKRRGGSLKDDRIKTMWNAGIQTKDIPEHILNEYVKNDVLNTEKIALQQFQEVKQQGMMNVVELHNKFILFTLMCEHSGMMVDKNLAEEIKSQLYKEQKELSDELLSMINRMIDNPNIEINLKSVDHLSALLYGGKIKVTKRMDILDENGDPVRFKTGHRKGEIKSRLEQVEYTVKGFGLKRLEELKASKEGFYQTGYKVLEKNRKQIKFIDVLLHYRKVTKLITTYVEDKGNSVIGLAHPDGLVHGNFNHCVTATGRLSSTKPNLQNIEKKSPLKSIFISRFKDGQLVQFDYSQLEIKTQGFLTQDPGILKDIKLGIDFYCKLLANVEDMSYEECYKLAKDLENPDPDWVEKRSKFKSVRLGMNYGMGIQKCAAETMLDLEDVKQIFDAVERLYPGVKQFNQSVYQKIVSTKLEKYKNHVYNFSTESGLRAQVGQWHDPLGGRYNLVEYDAPEFMVKKGTFKSFSPTQAKNFPNQGLAAHIVAIGAGMILDRIIPHSKYILPINTVHDSYIFDCDVSHVNTCIKILQDVSNQLPKYISEKFNVDFNVPLNGEISVGTNWRDMKVIK